MRWDSVSPGEYLTRPARLFVRNHTSTPVIDAARPTPCGCTATGWRRRAARPTRCRSPSTTCAGCRRPRSSPSTSARATGAASSARSRGRRRRARRGSSVPSARSGGTAYASSTCCGGSGSDPEAVSIQATGLDPNYVSGGVDYGPVRRPFPVAKALDDAILAWGMNGKPLLRDHGYPLRLVLPGWVGIGSIKWLGLARGLDHRAHLAVEHQVVPDDRWLLPRRQPAAHREPGALGVGAAVGRPAAGAARSG